MSEVEDVAAATSSFGLGEVRRFGDLSCMSLANQATNQILLNSKTNVDLRLMP